MVRLVKIYSRQLSSIHYNITMNFFFLAAERSMWEITVPCQRWNLHPLHWKLGVLTTRPSGKSYNTALVTTAIMLYIRSSEFIHLITRSLCPLTHISHPPAPHPIINILPSVSIAQPQLCSSAESPPLPLGSFLFPSCTYSALQNRVTSKLI